MVTLKLVFPTREKYSTFKYHIIESELEEDNECDSDEGNDDCFYSSAEEQKKNKQTLNSTFELFGISPITDM